VEVIQHTFETRLVKSTDGFYFYRLSKDSNGKFYFISNYPVQCKVYELKDVIHLLNELETASKQPILDYKDIINLSTNTNLTPCTVSDKQLQVYNEFTKKLDY
jgi:hypothetical protein